jgi:hypothetical protein
MSLRSPLVVENERAVRLGQIAATRRARLRLAVASRQKRQPSARTGSYRFSLRAIGLHRCVVATVGTRSESPVIEARAAGIIRT